MKELRAKEKEAADFILKHIDEKPKIGVILGTGLGGFSKTMKIKKSIKYEEIPHFPRSTVKSHAGEFLYGFINDNPVFAMQGRFHFYEGYSLLDVTFPVRVMKALGIEVLMVSNASGGLNPLFKQGDLMIIEDHINFMGVNPLIGPNDDALGQRFPDMSEPYSKILIELAEEVAIEEKIALKKGVYIGVTGPCLETRAEYRCLRFMGADAVGMSTVPEVIVAVHAGLKVFGISCVTDLCLPDALRAVSLEEILAIAERSEPLLNTLVSKLICKVSEMDLAEAR